jgi:hypothetical protein
MAKKQTSEIELHPDAWARFERRSGSFAGSSTTYNGGKNTSAYDRNGRFDGSAIKNSDGTTSFYDRSGRFTGSSSRATQPK